MDGNKVLKKVQAIDSYTSFITAATSLASSALKSLTWTALPGVVCITVFGLLTKSTPLGIATVPEAAAAATAAETDADNWEGGGGGCATFWLLFILFCVVGAGAAAYKLIENKGGKKEIEYLIPPQRGAATDRRHTY
uniref:Uncharacterized protein n=1 Tax=Glossina brevipalpis TaxID=37001 RepID=A0A1A9W351_9MUSC